MKRRAAAQKGSSLVEMLMVLCLIALFGICLVSLIIGGANAHGRIDRRMANENESRIALSFINVKLRQNDVQSTVEVLNEGKALRILTGDEDARYYNWIFFDSGGLYECMKLDDTPPGIAESDRIAEVDGCLFEAHGNSIVTTIYYDGDEHMASMVSLRAGEVLT